MAVRLFEDQQHAAQYLQHRVRPDEVVAQIMSQLREKDKGHAAEYLRLRPTPDEVVEQIVGLLQHWMALPADLAVDVGCGSGQGTVLLGPYFNQVIGTDISPAQLEHATANQRDNVSYRQCPAEDLPLDGGSVDLLTSMTAAHWFDRPRFLLEVDRVLKPGGGVALLSYGMDMELERGDVSQTLKLICQELYTALIPFRNPYLSTSSKQIYKDMYALCSYPDKQWFEGVQVRRDITVNGFIDLVRTFSCFRKYLETDAQEAEELCTRIRNKLMDALQVSAADADVTMVTKYFYWIARKPREEKNNV